MWYGLKIGLTYSQTLDIPFGMLLDLAAVEQVKHEGAKLRRPDESDDEFMQLLTWR